MDLQCTPPNSVAILAILFLLGFGLVLYAVPVRANTPAQGSSQSADSSQSSIVYFHLVAAYGASTSGNASGYAGITVSGLTMSLEWLITGGAPGESLTMVMQAAGTSGASKSFTFATVTVSSQGTAGGTGTATLDPDTYSVGLKVTDPNTTNARVVFVSDPSAAQVTLASSQELQTSTALGNSLSYSLEPLPTYLHEAVTSGYPFKEGGALIIVAGDTLEVTTSFLGAPRTVFTDVVQTAGSNITVGTVMTTSTGGGVFKGNITLSPGTHQVGLLLFANGKTVTPVAVSVPRSVQVTLTGSSTSSTRSTHSSTASTTDTSHTSYASSSSTRASSSTRNYSTVSTSSTTATSGNTARTETATSSTQTSAPVQGTTGHLDFVHVTTAVAPGDYPYGQGSGGYSVTGGSIYFSLAFAGQSPGSIFALLLSVNGTASTIGTYVTNASGVGSFTASKSLGTGKFLIALSVVDESSFNGPTTVLMSDPSTFTVNAYGGSSSTTTTESTTPAVIQTPRGPEWTFKLEPSTIVNIPKGYRFASSGTAVVSLDTTYSILNVEIGLEGASQSTTYNAALILNGTSESLGTMTTSKAGGALLQSSIQVTPGTYLLGIAIFDISNVEEFNANGPVLVMVSSPNTELAVISSTGGQTSGSTTSTSTANSTPFTTVTTSARTIGAGNQIQAQIQSAVNNLTIPATIQVSPLSKSTTVLDSRFSLSVGEQAGNGLVIDISGQNVTGPRALLIDVSRTSPLALYPALNVTLDGAPVVEAESALQVLNPLSSNPPMYVLIATPDSVQLLISIPHFSTHLIQVAGEVIHTVETTLLLDAPILAGSMVVITLVFGGAYAARKRYFSILL